jgi:hypothetical protein
MGLGKTLTMISLVATDLDRNSSEDVTLDTDEETKPRVSATLIIIPPPRKSEEAVHPGDPVHDTNPLISVIGTWEDQLSEQVLVVHYQKPFLLTASSALGMSCPMAWNFGVIMERRGLPTLKN